ncbi:hypothetical protein B0T21DRAFT_350403 [Apiosordaria backusii]|uniref:Uncharacterized protein n=1 Tax=Apiosordaria backusii TaxID=314023 RepID=A0AA40E340_9PEZI|nr:hypothetical protein B0T21DRAFT_350403 [Apiosordaria backusii]
MSVPYNPALPPGMPGGPPGPPPFTPGNNMIPPPNSHFTALADPFAHDRRREEEEKQRQEQQKKHEWDESIQRQIRAHATEGLARNGTSGYDGGTSFSNNANNPSSHITFNGPSTRSRRRSSTKTSRRTSSPSPSSKSAKSKSSTHTKGSRRKKFNEDTKKVAESVKSQSKSALGKLKKLGSKLKKKMSDKKKKLSKKRKQKTNSLFKPRVQLENPTDVAEGVVPEGTPTTVDAVPLPEGKQEDGTTEDKGKGKEAQKKKGGFGGWFGGKK